MPLYTIVVSSFSSSFKSSTNSSSLSISLSVAVFNTASIISTLFDSLISFSSSMISENLHLFLVSSIMNFLRVSSVSKDLHCSANPSICEHLFALCSAHFDFSSPSFEHLSATAFNSGSIRVWQFFSVSNSPEYFSDIFLQLSMIASFVHSFGMLSQAFFCRIQLSSHPLLSLSNSFPVTAPVIELFEEV